MKILLVDDEQLALDKLERQLAFLRPDAERFAFRRAREAMEFAEKNLCDVALLDINMRVLDGITMAKKLQKINPRINIIFCTGYTEYMPEAFELYCSGYLTKPVSREDLQCALNHLRYPETNKPRLILHCFGNFDAFYNGRSLPFRYKKTKELLAYLTDRKGMETTTQEVLAAILENRQESYFSNLRLDLIDTMEKLGIPEVIRFAYGRLQLDITQVDCDYYDYLNGQTDLFHGEYMTQYSWAEETCGLLYLGVTGDGSD